MWMLKSLSKLDDPDIKVHAVCVALCIHFAEEIRVISGFQREEKQARQQIWAILSP